MKANAISAADRQRMAKICKAEVERQLDDAVTRAQYLWIGSMLAVGLSPKTVARVQSNHGIAVAMAEQWGGIEV